MTAKRFYSSGWVLLSAGLRCGLVNRLSSVAATQIWISWCVLFCMFCTCVSIFDYISECRCGMWCGRSWLIKALVYLLGERRGSDSAISVRCGIWIAALHIVEETEFLTWAERSASFREYICIYGIWFKSVFYHTRASTWIFNTNRIELAASWF